jgi:catechol 2,3-dioxygenase-like lactoylglutathione lyase family enzyme
MFSHIAVGANDLKKAKRFYDGVMVAIGYGPAVIRSDGGYAYLGPNSFFIVTEPRDGRQATHANGGTIGFSCKSSEEVDLWHAAGVANGGRSIEEPPGIRNTPFGQLYVAYLRDPEGNKLCALHRMST